MTTFKDAQIIIGIDPDLEKSGVAILGSELQLKNMTFPETVDLFRKETGKIIKKDYKTEVSNFVSQQKVSIMIDETREILKEKESPADNQEVFETMFKNRIVVNH